MAQGPARHGGERGRSGKVVSSGRVVPPRTTKKVARFFKALYLKLFRINDTPQKIAAGFGIGVFSGVLPGTGPVAALFLAFVLRVNRAAALLGSILTNTWLSIPVFLIAVKAGAALTGVRYQDIRSQWDVFLQNFRWDQLLSLSVYKIIGPVLVGYFAVALCVGMACYLVTFFTVLYIKRRRYK